MNRWHRFWHWLTKYPAFSADQMNMARAEGYQIGLAQGELIGRAALSKEIEIMFPPYHAMTADDAQLVKARQVH